MTGVAIEVDGANELHRRFRRAAGNTKDLRAAHKRVAKVVETASKSRAMSVGTRQQAKAARVLLAKGTGTAATLSIRNLGSVPFGLGAFLGAHRYRQFPAWVGNRWDLSAGDGPYVIAEAIRDERDEIVATFENEIGAALRAAGLDVTITT